jgi:hypothetical protein
MRKLALAAGCAAIALAWAAPAALAQQAAPPRTQQQQAAAVSPELARQIAADAYIFAYPLVLTDVTARQLTNVPAPAFPLTPVNTIAHAREFPGPEFRIVIRPNFDTLYSSGQIDLGPEPVILSIPATDRYFMFPLLSMWTDVFAVPGTRTTGPNAAREFLLVSPAWRGEVPEGLELIRSPTRFVSFIGRTQTNGPADYATVHRIQDGMRLTPLSARGRADWRPPAGRVDPSVDMRTPAPETVAAMDARGFFRRFSELLPENPSAPQDYPTLHRMERIGLRVGQPFDLDAQPAAIRGAIEQGVAEGKARLRREYERLDGVGQRGWVYTTEGGAYGVNYLLRAGVAAWGFGMNLPQDAIYPSLATDSQGRPLDGAHRYVLRFERGQLPPVDGFWSVTAYDKDGYFIANPIRRYALGDRSDLRAGPDGAVEMYVQSNAPGSERDAKWLPVAPGSFNLMLRLYSPQDRFLRGEWTPPQLVRAE